MNKNLLKDKGKCLRSLLDAEMNLLILKLLLLFYVQPDFISCLMAIKI